MAAFTKINDFTLDVANKAHNLGADTLTIALSNTAPASETSNPTADGNGVLANVTQIAYTNLSSRVLTGVGTSLSAGVTTLTATDLTLTASGAVATFQYVYLYNDTALNDELIGIWDYGSAVTMANLETFLIDIQASGILTLT